MRFTKWPLCCAVYKVASVSVLCGLQSGLFVCVVRFTKWPLCLCCAVYKVASVSVLCSPGLPHPGQQDATDGSHLPGHPEDGVSPLQFQTLLVFQTSAQTIPHSVTQSALQPDQNSDLFRFQLRQFQTRSLRQLFSRRTKIQTCPVLTARFQTICLTRCFSPTEFRPALSFTNNFQTQFSGCLSDSVLDSDLDLPS